MQIFPALLTSLLLFLPVLTPSAHAWTEGALKVADPSAFTPNDLTMRDFKLEGPVLWEWVEDSMEWVRIDAQFVVPRAKVRLTVPATAKVTYQKQVFQPTADGKVEVPIVLAQEHYGMGHNEIVVDDYVTHQMSRATIVFKPLHPLAQAIVLDTSCSPYRLQLSEVKLTRSWVYVYCKMIHQQTGGVTGQKLDVDVYWEMEGSPESVFINNKPVGLDDGLTTSIAVDSNTPNWTFHRGTGDQAEGFNLEAHLGDRFHPLGVALGLGPYSHQNVVRAFTTVYASYYFKEQLKLAAFGAFPIRQSPEIDLGLYLIAEQVKGIDERLIVNLLLGFHTLSYVPDGTRVAAFSAPQGVELIFKDFLAKRQNLMVGGFFYPDIKDRFYVNTWIRYGGAYFAEINFINWQEPVAGGGTFSSKSFGLSIGFPLFRAL